jgi:hypothetical protein
MYFLKERRRRRERDKEEKRERDRQTSLLFFKDLKTEPRYLTFVIYKILKKTLLF